MSAVQNFIVLVTENEIYSLILQGNPRFRAYVTVFIVVEHDCRAVPLQHCRRRPAADAGAQDDDSLTRKVAYTHMHTCFRYYLSAKTIIIEKMAVRAENTQKTVTTFTSLQPDNSK